VQLCRAPDVKDPLRYAAALLAVIVGDDRGSRFFWEIVGPGHAEACDLSYNSYEGEGVYQTYLCCTPDEYSPDISRVHDLFAKINASGVTEDELQLAKSKVASRIVLRSERPMGRLSNLGHNWVSRREYRAAADDLAAIQRVTTSDIRTLLERFPLQQTTSVGVGPLTDGA
jgi:predicted Zn-dependent peptidase